MARAASTVTPACSGDFRRGTTTRVPAHEDLRLEQRATRDVGADEREPIGQDRALEVREIVGTRPAGSRPLLKHGQIGHAAASATSRGT